MLKNIFAYCILISVLILSGCHGNRETDTLATVMAVGVDLDDNGQKSYTFAIADTGGISKESSGDGTSVICFSLVGEDIKTAIDTLDSRLSKKVSFSHLSVLIFSCDSARAGMYDEVNFFENMLYVRPQTMIALTDGSAGKYLETLNPYLEANLEKYFQSILQKSDFYVSSLRICDFTNAYYSKTSALAPLIITEKNSDKFAETDAFVKGSGFIQNGKLSQIIEDNAVLGLLLSDKRVYLNSSVIKSRKRAKMYVDTSGKSPVFKAYITLDADKNTDKKELKKHVENTLLSYAKENYDVTDALTVMKKSFVLQKKYDEYKNNTLPEKMKFDIIIK